MYEHNEGGKAPQPIECRIAHPHVTTGGIPHAPTVWNTPNQAPQYELPVSLNGQILGLLGSWRMYLSLSKSLAIGL